MKYVIRCLFLVSCTVFVAFVSYTLLSYTFDQGRHYGSEDKVDDSENRCNNGNMRSVIELYRKQYDGNTNSDVTKGENDSALLGHKLVNRYRVDHYLTSGIHAVIYLGTDVYSGERVVVKEDLLSRPHSTECEEGAVLTNLQGGEGIPSLKWFGTANGRKILITKLLGPDLDYMVHNMKFDLRTVLLIAMQLIDRLEYIHSKGYIHGDVITRNVVLGSEMNCYTVFLIDFGSAIMYIDTTTGKHRPYAYNEDVNKRSAFSSIATQLGINSTRRDDMDALGYCLLFFLRKDLPWEEKYLGKVEGRRISDKMLNLKKLIPIRDLCKDFPKEFELYLHHCRTLRYDEEPDYAYLSQLFENVYRRNRFTSLDLFE